jgi:hypothetical protein
MTKVTIRNNNALRRYGSKKVKLVRANNIPPTYQDIPLRIQYVPSRKKFYLFNDSNNKKLIHKLHDPPIRHRMKWIKSMQWEVDQLKLRRKKALDNAGFECYDPGDWFIIDVIN